MCRCCFCCCCRKKKNNEKENRNTVDFPVPTVSSMIDDRNVFEMDEEDEFYNGSDISESHLTSVSQQTPIINQPLPSIPIPNIYTNQSSNNSTIPPFISQSSQISLTLSHKDSSTILKETDSNKITLKGSVNINGTPKNIIATLEIDKNEDDSGMSSISSNSYKNLRDSSGYLPMSPGNEDIYINTGYYNTYETPKMDEKPKVDRNKKPTMGQIKILRGNKTSNYLSRMKKIPKPLPRENEHIYETIHYYTPKK